MNSNVQIETAHITPYGVYYKKRLYSCREAIRHNWFGQACKGPLQPINLIVLSCRSDVVLVQTLNSNEWIICRQLSPRQYEENEKYYQQFQMLAETRKKLRNKS